jgi:Putative adhesin
MLTRSRTPVFAVLIAAEIAIVGLAAYSIRGAISGNVIAGGGTGADFAAKTFAPIAAGTTPRVTIDDPNSGVTIGVSSDGQVHVKDDTSFSGVSLRSPHGYPQLTVTQDFNGVHISRAAYHQSWAMFIGFSSSRQHFEVQVPANATVVVTACDNAEVSDLKNGATIKALDGRIELTHVEGAIVAHTDDGHVAADDVTSPSLDLSSDDGWIEAHNFTAAGSAPYVRLHSRDGHVTANGLFPAGGKYDIGTSDGRVTLALAHGSDVTIDASTNDGSVRVDGVRTTNGDGAQQSIRVGSGGSAMRVHSDDGSVTITTNAATR